MIDINKMRRLALDGDLAAMQEIILRLEAAESEAIEQARLNGMGAEREAALLAKLEAAERERDKLKELNIAWGKQSNSQLIHNARLAGENYTLRAKISEMEKQEPLCITTRAHLDAMENGAVRSIVGRDPAFATRGPNDIPLYALPGAQPAPSVPDDIVREVLRDCCGTFHGSRHRITCEKYKGKKAPEAKP